MSDNCTLNIARQFTILNKMFQDIDTTKEADFVENARHSLEKEGLLINQCPHWCERIDVLCACILDAKPAPDCTIAGVVGGDFLNDKKALSQFVDIINIKSA